MGVFKLLATSVIVGANGAVRTGAGVAEMAVRRTPSLVLMGARATVGAGPQGARAQAAFRDELFMLLDEATEIAWRQARGARDQLDLRTSPAGPVTTPEEFSTGAPNGDPTRRHRVKA